MFHFLDQLHTQVFFWMYYLTQKYPAYNNEVHFIADKLDNYVIALAGLVLFYFVYRSIEHHSWKRFYFLAREGFQILISVSIAWGISYLTKITARMPRPFLRFSNEVTPLFDYGGMNSLPSGHATLFMALAMMIYLIIKKQAIFLYFLQY